jgi:MoaA/NifB/PqqE/SkfB family radical SAM enzyme
VTASPQTPPQGVFPSAPLLALDTLWLQVAGTICNLTCTHCFISCSPANHAHEMMSKATVERFLNEAIPLGVKEFYLTGGEPFLNRDIFDIVEMLLRHGPVTVLTNGILILEREAARLRVLSDGSEYSLDVRVSMEGWDASTNDPIRGAGTFERIVAGILRLHAAGLNPVITVSEALNDAGASVSRERFLIFLRDLGLTRPRLKIMPLLRLGAEETRSRAYATGESLRGVALLDEAAVRSLVCTSGRMATSRGVFVCPILIDSAQARMGDQLVEALRPFELSSNACHTCYVEGLSCRT